MFGGSVTSFIDMAVKKQGLKRTLSEENYLRSIIEQMVRVWRFPKDTDLYQNEMIDCYRYLRNRVADPDLSPVLVDTFNEFAHALADHVDKLRVMDDPSSVIVLRVAIQFLGNAVSRPETAATYREAVWRNACGTIFCMELLDWPDEKIREYGAMLVYNCLRDPCVRSDVIGCANELVEPIFHRAPYPSELYERESEWYLFAAQLLLSDEEELLKKNWSQLHPPIQLRVIRVALETMLQNNDNKDGGGGEGDATAPRIHEGNAKYLASSFVSEAAELQRAIWPVEEYEIDLCSALLAFLCRVTALEGEFESIRNDSSVLGSALNLLKLSATNSEQQNSKEELEKLSKLCESSCVIADESSSATCSPLINFRSRLVRLVANMCYKNGENKKFVHDNDGIAAILNSTQLDAENVFITQWSVFALRNLLDGCLENQRFVERVTALGTAGGSGDSASPPVVVVANGEGSSGGDSKEIW